MEENGQLKIYYRWGSAAMLTCLATRVEFVCSCAVPAYISRCPRSRAGVTSTTTPWTRCSRCWRSVRVTSLTLRRRRISYRPPFSSWRTRERRWGWSWRKFRPATLIGSWLMKGQLVYCLPAISSPGTLRQIICWYNRLQRHVTVLQKKLKRMSVSPPAV